VIERQDKIVSATLRATNQFVAMVNSDSPYFRIVLASAAPLAKRLEYQ
jgi:hypothetical protein